MGSLLWDRLDRRTCSLAGRVVSVFKAAAGVPTSQGHCRCTWQWLLLGLVDWYGIVLLWALFFKGFSGRPLGQHLVLAIACCVKGVFWPVCGGCLLTLCRACVLGGGSGSPELSGPVSMVGVPVSIRFLPIGRPGWLVGRGGSLFWVHWAEKCPGWPRAALPRLLALPF